MRYFRLALFLMSIFTVALMLSGCSSAMIHSDPPSGTVPAVINVGVQVNGVAPNRWQYAQFNEAMDPATINSQTIVVSDAGGNAVPGKVMYDASFNVAGFQPDPALQQNAGYTFTVTTGAASTQGVPLAQAYSYKFTTRATTDHSPIYVKNVTPFPDASCVSAATPITIVFSEGADVSTLNSTNIVITGPGNTVIAAKIGYDVATATVTLTPNAPLPSGSITVNVNNVADAAGVKMTSPFMWSFLTTCSGSGGGANAQYMAPLLNFAGGPNAIHGKVTIDTSGNTTVQLTGAPASTTYTVQFCPAVAANATVASPPTCFNLTAISTDTSGNATVTVKFPQPGDWAGDFYINDSSGKEAFQTYLDPSLANETYMATLLPDTMTNGGAVTSYSPQDPLSSGTVSFSNGKLQFTVKGASPNTAYDTNSSETVYIDSSGTYELNSFTTDASGNGSVSFTWGNLSPGGDLFQVENQADNTGKGPAGFIGGFSVPQ